MAITINRTKRSTVTDFQDIQVATLIGGHQQEELCIEDLVKIAKKDMPKFFWNNDKIRNSVTRLEKRGRIASKYVIREKRLCRVPYPV